MYIGCTKSPMNRNCRGQKLWTPSKRCEITSFKAINSSLVNEEEKFESEAITIIIQKLKAKSKSYPRTKWTQRGQTTKTLYLHPYIQTTIFSLIKRKENSNLFNNNKLTSFFRIELGQKQHYPINKKCTSFSFSFEPNK